MKVEAKLKEMGLELPPAPKPAGTYVPTLQVGDLLYLSGHGPVKSDGTMIEGKVGRNLDLDQAAAAARQVGLSLLASLKTHLGDLDKVKRIVKLLGFVNSTDDFVQQPNVINGCSDLLVELYGDNGRHARYALGTSVLPFNIPVEIEMIVQVQGG